MKSKNNSFKGIVKKTIITVILVCLIAAGTYAIINKTVLPIAKAASEDIAWNVTINIAESGGAGDNVIFGEATDAADGQDDYDLIKPPFPPQLPYLAAWFDTNLDEPYDMLWFDYKQYPDDCKTWNLSIIWMSEPEDESSTNIDISWDASKIIESKYKSVLLYENDTVVADMIGESHYIFNSSGGSLHHFQIICQSGTVNGNETPFLHIILIIMTIVLFTLYLKKNN